MSDTATRYVFCIPVLSSRLCWIHTQAMRRPAKSRLLRLASVACAFSTLYTEPALTDGRDVWASMYMASWPASEATPCWGTYENRTTQEKSAKGAERKQ